MKEVFLVKKFIGTKSSTQMFEYLDNIGEFSINPRTAAWFDSYQSALNAIKSFTGGFYQIEKFFVL